MKFFCSHIIFVFLLFITGSCCFCDEEKIVAEPEKPILTFAVAGHVYGSPGILEPTIYRPFLKQIKKDILSKNISGLFLTGDVVAESTKENWDAVKAQLDSLRIDWYISRGNHDISQYLDQNIQPEKYLAVKESSNLFLVLNSNFPGWTLDSAEIIFVENELKNVQSGDNIFVFTHQLWWEKNRPHDFGLDSVRSNSHEFLEGKSDFWQDAFPLFDSLTNQVYFFAGDIGSHHLLESYYEDHYKNYHFYASGMGGGKEDNYLVVSVFKNGDVEIERIDF